MIILTQSKQNKAQSSSFFSSKFICLSFYPLFLFRVVVLDEFDLLTSESAIMKSTLNILNRYGCGSRLSLSKRQFIFAGSALPANPSSAFSFLSQDFSKFAQTFQSPGIYKFNPSTTHEIIQTSQYLDAHRDMSIQDILAKVISNSKSKKIIVFVNQPPAAIQLAQYLNAANISATPFHASQISFPGISNILIWLYYFQSYQPRCA